MVGYNIFGLKNDLKNEIEEKLNKLLLHHAQPDGRCRPVNTAAIRANRRKLLILAFLVLLCAAGYGIPSEMILSA